MHSWPFVVIRPTVAPVRCTMMLVATVEPCAIRIESVGSVTESVPSCSAAASMLAKKPVRKLSDGMLRAFAVVVSPSSPITTQSVTVPPTSIAIM